MMEYAIDKADPLLYEDATVSAVRVLLDHVVIA
jgi:hypothetical protein